MTPVYIDTGALFDPTRVYRYRLWRAWAPGPRVCFVMLNCSTADEHVLDPTIRRCVGFARAWGFGGLEVVNLFALRSTDPRALYSHADPIGPGNDEAILAAAAKAHMVVAGWGVHGALLARGSAVRQLLEGRRLYHLGLTANGHPKHPLYLRADTTPLVCGRS